MASEKLLLVDLDPGVDDCLGLMMLLAQHPKVRVVGLTSANGNVGLTAVTKNTVRIVKLYDMLDQIPIYKGCLDPMVEMPIPNKDWLPDAGFYHGKDGLGDVPKVDPPLTDELLQHVEKKHAVKAIVRLAKMHSGKLEMVCLGALTNLALASKLDPELPKHLKALHILGGTIRGYGNQTPCAEYNFYTDPEAAYTIFKQFPSHCPTQILPVEVTTDSAAPADWFNRVISGKDRRSTFFREVSKHTRTFEDTRIASGMQPGYTLCDSYLAAAVLDPAAIQKSKMVKMGMELSGIISRGSLIIDHKDKGSPQLSPVPMKLIEEMNMDVYKRLVEQTFRG